MKSIEYFLNGALLPAELIDLPDTCPMCEYSSVEFNHLMTYGVKSSPYTLQAIFMCPRNGCGYLFIGIYTRTTTGMSTVWKLQSTPILTLTKRKEFGKHINSASPKFEEIYNQALTAEANGLDDVCGPGFGKALEFLLKGFLVHEKPEEEEKIKAIKNIGALLDRLSDPKTKIVVERATWLRNDETHYTKKFEDRDVQDLKKLIDLSVHWIEASLDTEEYEKNMQSQNKKDPKEASTT